MEYERFFSGATLVPPEAMRDEIRDRIKNLRAGKSPSLVFTFRLNNVEAKFNSFNELYNRKARTNSRRVAQVQVTAARPPADSHVVVGEKPDTRSTEQIYTELYSSDQKKPSFEAFEAFLSQQVRRIQEQTGCDKVSLRVSTDSGKARLRAKPVETA